MSCPTRGRELFRRGLFLEPLPTGDSRHFICTPHRGSFVAGRRMLANITCQLLSLPFALPGWRPTSTGTGRREGRVRANGGGQHVARAPLHHGAAGISVAPSVKVNSIIAVEGTAGSRRDDGVVKYSAAHIEPVESELVVRSGHSVQGNPHAIEEVRRILRLHAGLK